ncbi:MAG: cyanophycin synthetase, partial [Bacteroidota bacterium]
ADNEWTKTILPVAIERTRCVGFSSSHKLDEGAFLYESAIIAKNKNAERTIAESEKIRIPGKHNIENALAATLAALEMGIPPAQIAHTLATFPGVEHRIEFVAEKNRVMFYNDSKATNVDSLEKALQAFTLKENKIILLLGGREQAGGNDYSQIEELIAKNVRTIIAIGESAEKIAQYFSQKNRTVVATSMKEAIEFAQHESVAGDIVLLSPACKSFDWFEDFEHRGKVFKELVYQLQ